MQEKLAVALPIKFSFFTICYGSTNLYFWEQKNEPFAHISLHIRAVTTHKDICQSFMFLKCEGWSFDCLTGRAAERQLLLIVFVHPPPVSLWIIIYLFRIAWMIFAGKELLAFHVCCGFFTQSWLFVFLSRVVSGEVCRIRLCRFLIIAFLSTLSLGEERADLCASRVFVCLFCTC